MQSWPSAETIKQQLWKMSPCTWLALEMLSFLTMETHHGKALVMSGVCAAPCGFTALHHCTCTTAVTRNGSDCGIVWKYEGKAALIYSPCSMFQIYSERVQIEGYSIQSSINAGNVCGWSNQSTLWEHRTSNQHVSDNERDNLLF